MSPEKERGKEERTGMAGRAMVLNGQGQECLPGEKVHAGRQEVRSEWALALGEKGGFYGKGEGVGAKTVVVTGEAATGDVFSSNI